MPISSLTSRRKSYSTRTRPIRTRLSAQPPHGPSARRGASATASGSNHNTGEPSGTPAPRTNASSALASSTLTTPCSPGRPSVPCRESFDPITGRSKLEKPLPDAPEDLKKLLDSRSFELAGGLGSAAGAPDQPRRARGGIARQAEDGHRSTSRGLESVRGCAARPLALRADRRRRSGGLRSASRTGPLVPERLESTAPPPPPPPPPSLSSLPASPSRPPPPSPSTRLSAAPSSPPPPPARTISSNAPALPLRPQWSISALTNSTLID